MRYWKQNIHWYSSPGGMNGFIMRYICFYSQQTTLHIMLQVRVKQQVTVLMYAAIAGEPQKLGIGAPYCTNMQAKSWQQSRNNHLSLSFAIISILLHVILCCSKHTYFADLLGESQCHSPRSGDWRFGQLLPEQPLPLLLRFVCLGVSECLWNQ